ncbi:nucleolin [Cloeon dipterum]|uniref:nucleolin n=1 Tax=Cloeon dipterum TaxID=197152 RepID=UPI00321FAB0A
MTKWTSIALALVVLAAVAANATPITNGASHKVMGRQGDAPSAEVVTSAPAAAAAPAASAEEEDDDEDDDDDDYDIEDALGDDDDDDEEEDDEAEDDEEEDDDEDYLDRFFDDILADDDDDDDESPPKPKPSKAPVVATTSAPVAQVIKDTVKPDDDDDADDDLDEVYDSVGAGSTNNDVKKPSEGGLEDYLGEDDEAEKDESTEDDDEEDEDDEETVEDEDDEDDDDDDDLTQKRSRSLKGQDIPAAHLVKYNEFVDSIIGKINEVLKQTFDPVSIKLTRGSQTPSRKPVSKPKGQSLENASNVGPAYEVVDLTQESSESETPLTRTKRVRSHRTLNVGSTQKKKKTNKNQLRAQRAHATLIGLSSVRRDGDVVFNKYADHSTIKSNFLIGPLVLRVEKAFGRGAKKELRSATATTDKMSGRMVLKINQDGIASMHSIRVLQPKQVRVESDDDHEQTREFVWKRSSHIARVVSQKLTKAAREMLGVNKNQTHA